MESTFHLLLKTRSRFFIRMDFKKEIIKLLVKETKLPENEIASLLTIPPDPKLGNYAFPGFKLGKNPVEEVKKLKQQIKLPKFLSGLQAVGPYLNFYLKNSILAEETLSKIDKNYGTGEGKKNILIEYCGPNTNKPLHLGHIRNMALGKAMCNILSFQGNKVHPVNIVNDRGIHICQSMIAYQKWGKEKNPDKKPDHFVGDYYVMFSQKAKEDESLKKEAQKVLLKWEQKEPDIRKLWKKMNGWVLEGFQETYQRFGVKFEKEYFESEMYEKGKELVQNSNVFVKDEEGNLVVKLEEYGMPNKIVLRADGTSVYMTQDLYVAEKRYLDYKFNQMIYVVANEQNNHFQQLFKILELLKKPYAKSLHHLSYGLVHLPSGRMKSREGTVIDADDLMDEISGLAEKEVRKRYQKLSEKEIKERAEFISLGAIKFFMLRTDSNRDIIFNPEESLSFEGETGPYLQYTHARACSILRKAQKEHKLKVSKKVNFESFGLQEELAVIRLLYGFPEIVAKSAETYKLHHLAQYLISLAQAFNEFYHKCPVISEQEHQMKARLLLVDSTRQVLDTGLGLLGIKALEEM